MKPVATLHSAGANPVAQSEVINDPPATDLRADAVRGVAWSLIRMFVSQLVMASVFLVLARLLMPQDFGLVALAMVFVSLISILQDQGFAQAIVRHPVIDSVTVSTAFWLTVALSLVLSAGMYGAGVVLAQTAHARDLPHVLLALIPAVVLTAVESVPGALLLRRLQVRALAIRDITASIVGGGVGIACALAGAGVWSLVAQSLVQAAVGCVLTWRAAHWRPGLVFSPATLRPLLPTSVSLLMMALLTFGMTRIDDMLVASYLGTVALGFYSVAYRIYVLTGDAAINAVANVATAALSRLQHDVKRLQGAAQSAIEHIGLIACPAFAGMTVLAPLIIETVFGPRWTPAANALSVLCALGFWQCAWFVLQSALIAIGHAGSVLAVSIVSTCASVAGFFIAVPWGYTAVAASFVVRAYLVTAPMGLMLARRHLGIGVVDLVRRLYPGVACSGSTAIATVCGRILTRGLPAPAALALCLAVGVLAYVSTVRLGLGLSLRQLHAQIAGPRRRVVVDG